MPCTTLLNLLREPASYVPALTHTFDELPPPSNVSTNSLNTYKIIANIHIQHNATPTISQSELITKQKQFNEKCHNSNTLTDAAAISSSFLRRSSCSRRDNCRWPIVPIWNACSFCSAIFCKTKIRLFPIRFLGHNKYY